MLRMFEIRGKKANKNRWEALKLLDWEKDSEVIEKIFSITNPLYFSSRTPEKAIADVRADLELKAKFKAYGEMQSVKDA